MSSKRYWIFRSDVAGDIQEIQGIVTDTLDHWGWHASVKKGLDADLWIYPQSLEEVHLSVDQIADLDFPESVRGVLLLRSQNTRVIMDSEIHKSVRWNRPAVLAIDFREGMGKYLQYFLNSLRAGSRHERVWSSQIHRLGSLVLNLQWDIQHLLRLLYHIGEIKGLSDPKTFSEQLAEWLRAGDTDEVDQWKVREALLYLIAEEAGTRHDIRANLDRPFSDRDKIDIINAWRSRRFLEFCSDLNASLNVPANPCESGSILILDDHAEAEDFGMIYRAVGELLLGNKKSIVARNPFEDETGPVQYGAKRPRNLVDFLVDYCTFGARGGENEHMGHDLHDAIESARYILVDQRLDPPGQETDEMFGAQVIQGLIRWMRDNSANLNWRDGKIPEVIALSRTDDPEVIQAALRAGAKDYILKSRFTRLPVILDRVRHGSADAMGSLHRNFRALYKLPNENIGLLQNAYIPQIRFHRRSPKDAKMGADLKQGKWAALLKRLPKADLHVHAGSVMAREFLVLASAVMLARSEKHEERFGCGEDGGVGDRNLVELFHALLDAPRKGKIVVTPSATLAFGGSNQAEAAINISIKPGDKQDQPHQWFQRWAKAAARKIGERLDSVAGNNHETRAYLHRDLGIRDHLKGADAAKKLKDKNSIELALYLLRHASKVRVGRRVFKLKPYRWQSDDLIRIYLLVLAARYQGNGHSAGSLKVGEGINAQDLLPQFRAPPTGPPTNQGADDPWEQLHKLFFAPKESTTWGIDDFRDRGWAWPPKSTSPVKVDLNWEPRFDEDDRQLDFKKDPIGVTLATGISSGNLVSYLLGSEFSGAEHLRHPFLIHVYSRQVVMDWVRQGVVYAELKASPDGYIYTDLGFDYPSVVQCLTSAFAGAQREVLELFQTGTIAQQQVDWAGAALGSRYTSAILERTMARGDNPEADGTGFMSSTTALGRHYRSNKLPCKTSLVFVGKRHKSMREMILEAAGAAVMRPPGDKPEGSALHFMEKEFARCRVVGFDLAGPEAKHPPSEFAAEFGRLSRLHVPITVHAGENAEPKFIEDSVLELGAVRIGHGLSLAEDERLIARLRDDRVAIELCPVCNHQTSKFHGLDMSENDPGKRRPYPLAKFLKAGLYVTINTDNPIISDTNMVREMFQASWAFADEKGAGLSLWEALRVMRMGFVCSFLTLNERQYMLELVDQFLLDLFNDPKTLELLRELAG